MTGTLDWVQVRPVVLIDRSRNRHDVEIARGNVFDSTCVRQLLRSLEFGRISLQGAVPPGFKFGDARLLDVEADGLVMLAEFHGERQAHVAETDDANLASPERSICHM